MSRPGPIAPAPLRGKPRKLFTVDGEEVMLTLVCTACRKAKPFSAFGLRRMQDGKIRSIPWCTTCRGKRSSTHRSKQAALPFAEATP